MKRTAVFVALAATTASAQSTTDCTNIGGTVHCQTQPSQAGPDFRILQQPNMAGAAMQAYQQGLLERQRRQLEQERLALEQSRPQQAAPNGLPPLQKSTPREVYIGCGLMLEGTDVPLDADGRIQRTSASLCRSMARYYRSPKMSDPPQMRACPPASLADPDRDLAEAYLAFYDEAVSLMGKVDGPTAFDVALVRKWPC